MAIAVLELKLGACVNAPTKRARTLLHEAATQCNRARNAVMRHWQRWREDHPDWTPGQRRDRKGALKVSPDGKPVMEHPVMPQELQRDLYHVARRTAPAISSNVMSGCWSEVCDFLRAKTPYNHEGPSRFRWQAILNYEISAPSFRGLAIPAPSKNTELRCDESACTVTLSLLSKNSGYHTRGYAFRVEKRQLSLGNRKLIDRIANTPKMLRDSKVVFKRGEWFFQCTYESGELKSRLDQTQQAVLTPMTDQVRHPFELALPDGRRIKCGWADSLRNEYLRLTVRRKTIRNRHKSGVGRGRGRKKFEDILQPWDRAYRDFQDGYRKTLCAMVVQVMQRNNLGALLYREPSLPLRERSWFVGTGTPFDWTRLLEQLENAAERRRIVLVKEKRGRRDVQPRIGIPQHKAEYPDQWPEKKENESA